MTGGDVKEGINIHKKLYEALLRTKIEYVDVSMCGSETVETIQVNDCNEKESQVTIDELRQRVNSENFENLILSGSIEPLPTSSNSDMGWLMDTYIEMVDMLLNYTHFLRTGNWEGYLEVLFEFLPYCFRFNRQNYARNLSYDYVHMRALKEENIAAYKYLEEGGFSGSQTGKPHSRIPFDQVIKMTTDCVKTLADCRGRQRILVQLNGGQEFTIILLHYVNIKTRK